MLIYHVNGQTLCDQKLKISGISSPSLPVPEQKASEQGREGLQPVALTHHPARAARELCRQTDIFCVSFQPPPPQLCDNFLQFIFLKSSITKKPWTMSERTPWVWILAIPLCPTRSRVPASLANSKIGISKALVLHAKWFQILNQIFANKKECIFTTSVSSTWTAPGPTP